MTATSRKLNARRICRRAICVFTCWWALYVALSQPQKDTGLRNEERDTITFSNEASSYDLDMITLSKETLSETQRMAAGRNVAGDTLNLSSGTRGEIVLVTSLWADPSKGESHRKEILAAISLNAKNPSLATVFIVLDGSSPEHNCATLSIALEEQHEILASAISCLDREQGQPSYFDMFSYTQRFVGKVVILANADMTFDDTVGIVSDLRDDTILVIATRGALPAGTGSPQPSFVVHNRSADVPFMCFPPPKKRWSWDAFIFRPESLSLDDILFKDVSTGYHFKMNEIFAENAALHAIYKGSEALKHVYQVCDIINMWHHHLAPKMHRYADDSKRVKQWALEPTDCTDFARCPLTAPKVFRNFKKAEISSSFAVDTVMDFAR